MSVDSIRVSFSCIMAARLLSWAACSSWTLSMSSSSSCGVVCVCVCVCAFVCVFRGERVLRGLQRNRATPPQPIA